MPSQAIQPQKYTKAKQDVMKKHLNTMKKMTDVFKIASGQLDINPQTVTALEALNRNIIEYKLTPEEINSQILGISEEFLVAQQIQSQHLLEIKAALNKATNGIVPGPPPPVAQPEVIRKMSKEEKKALGKDI